MNIPDDSDGTENIRTGAVFYVRIMHFRGANRAVPKDRLDYTDVRALGKHIRCQSPPEFVRRQAIKLTALVSDIVP
ncbi:hypothetical protein SDC9_187307 [bioreactor metagenome]|uniref:Uncharacterized protein n=1 Tax=bioreactor metagenome TaxID=1076179 RepID=A0A645HLA8_9ZZZZ